MIAAMRAGDELDSRALVRNLLALLNQCLDKARQLVEKYEDSLSTGKPADDITDWHIFEIEVVKVRSLAEEYLEKDSVTDNRRDTTPNRSDTTNFITSTCLSGNFQSLTETFCNSRHSGNSLKIKYTDSQNFEIPPELTALEVLLEIFKLKTHSRTRKRWETLILSEPLKAANLEDFLRFLQDGIRVQESVSMGDRKPSSNVTVRTNSPPRNKLPSVAALHAETRSFESCVMCRERRRVSQCSKFLAEKTQHLWRIAASKNLCFRCLRRGHTGNWCPEDKRAGETSTVKPTTEKDEGVSSSRTLLGKTASEKENLLQTARAILKDLAESLRLRGTTERLALLRLGEMHSKYEKLRGVNFCLKGIYGGEDSYPIEALCVPRITTVDANPSAANWEHLHGLKLADIFPRERTEIDTILGLKEYNHGRYTVKQPWKPGFPNLPNNYAHALKRLLKTEASLLKEPLKSAMYSKTLRGRTWYLPHHMVFKTDQTSTKGRIVFDASAHFGRTSLSRQLEPGPSLQSGRLRMFLQIGLHKEDRDVTGFLWKEPSDPSPPQTFRFRRICFGLTSSPFLALAVMQHHARLYKSKWPKAAEKVLKHIYVDDLLFSLDDRTETMQCVKELKQLMETAGFHLTKWSSNKSSVLRSLPEEDVVSKSKAKMALGIVWDSKEDIITFPVVSVARPDQQMTKRGMLSVIMGIFDPLGYLLPFLVKAKRMLQVLWRKGIDWDTPLPQNMLKDWRNWIAEIPSISEIRLPRCWLPAGTDCIKEVELHGYGDVSEMAYGSAVYLRVTTISGETVVKLVMSKTRIAPVKRVTLPRLELMAALITARLISFVKTSLEMKFSKVACWTDSQIALQWIQGDSYRWKSFVGNRVESILELTDAQWWRHCSTTDNPADILTRGCRMKDLVSNNLWWHGPHWLTKCEDAGPMAKFELAIDRNPKFQAEVGKSAPYVFRFITNCKAVPEERKTTPLDVREIDQAEKFWLKALQNEKYQEDLESLKQEKKLPKSSILWPLNPYVDDNGILRLVSSLTAQRFLQALDRFFARRGQSKIIQSDNFTSFKEIGRNLNELVLETHRRLTSKRIEWKYITPRAAWCGGYWKRLVRSVKTALRKLLGKTSLDEEKLATVLCGIEAQSFARCALRPKSTWTNDGYRRTANKALELQKEEPKVGDVVLIAEDDVNKGRWMTGRVLELFHGRDGVVRSIRLKVAKGEITRPSKKLRLLEPAVIDRDPPSSGEDVADSNRRKKPERQ
ncbi:hypothetical protein T4D_12245, partial [Trichinella pseudospiralis]